MPTLSPRQFAEAAVIGVGATAVMDLVAETLRRTRGVPSLDYRLLGRWIGHFRRGRIAHESIMAAEPVPAERELGLTAHYGIGVGFAIALATLRPSWLERPAAGPALATGIGTVAAPWLIMQPAFGMGVAASKTPSQPIACARSLRAHAAYGLGLWLSGLAVRALRR